MSSTTNPPNPDDKRKAEELLQRFFDRELSIEGGEELLGLWDAGPDLECEARKHYLAEYSLVFASSLEKAPFRLPSFVPPLVGPVAEPFDFGELRSIGPARKTDPVDEAMMPGAVDPKKASPISIPARKEWLRSFVPLRYILPLIFLLWVLTMYWEFLPVTESEPPFYALARIEATADAVSGQPVSPLRENRRIATEPLSLLDGSVELLLENNVRIVLEGPCEFQLISAMNAFCSQGQVSVYVPPESTGFEVTTPTMAIRDLGTAFVVNVSEEQSELHVVEGKVEAGGQSKEALTFSAGLGAKINLLGKFVRFPADLSLFVKPEEMRRRVAASKGRASEREQRIADRLDRDPSVVLRLDFEDDRLDAKISGCRRIPGRNSGSTALLFEKRRDVVSCPGSLETDSLTLQATVRVDRLARITQTLFTCRDFGEGAVQWQIGHGGGLQVLIGRSENQSALNLKSDAVLSPGLYGTWVRLTAVLDGENRTVTHYLDGEEVGRNKLEKSFRFHLNGMEVGNWTPKEHSPTLRYFDGAIDDLVLFNRALTREEIKELSFID